MTISIRLNGRTYTGWTSAEVTASMSDATRSFTITMADMASWEFAPGFWAPPGSPVQVICDDAVVLDGYVNEYRPTISAEGHEIQIAGRGKSQDSVDCSAAAHPTGRFEDKTILEIAQELAQLVNNTVTSDEKTPTVSKFQVNQGETILGAIRRLTRAHGYSVMGNADGSMSIIRGTSSDRYGGLFLAEGRWPMLSISAVISDDKRYSDYAMKTQASGRTERAGLDASAGIATVSDPAVTRYRPFVGLLPVSSDSKAAQDAADWHARRLAGRSVNVDIDVQGFSYAGAPWEPNKLIYIHSPSLKLDHELLIESVTYRLDDGGSVTSLKLVPPKASKSSAGTSDQGKRGSEAGAAYPESDPEQKAPPALDVGSQWNWGDEVGPQ